TLNLDGANTYSGTTTVDGGTLNLDGSVIGDVAIGVGGTLSGNATVAGSLSTSGAVLASIDSGGSSKVAVSGAAALAGTLKIALAPSATSGTYEVLTASGITGTFGSVVFTGVTPTQYSISYLPTSVQIQIAMTGAVTLSGNSVSFGDVLISDSGSRSITLTNSGSAPLTITSIGTAAPFSSTNNCGTVLATSASCTINLSFAPIAAGSASGTLTVLSDALTSPDHVSLSGTGTQPAMGTGGGGAIGGDVLAVLALAAGLRIPSACPRVAGPNPSAAAPGCRGSIDPLLFGAGSANPWIASLRYADIDLQVPLTIKGVGDRAGRLGLLEEHLGPVGIGRRGDRQCGTRIEPNEPHFPFMSIELSGGDCPQGLPFKFGRCCDRPKIEGEAIGDSSR